MVLIVSDYHGHEQEVINLIELNKPEMVLCCGDGQSQDNFYEKYGIISVLGNCDTAKLPIVKTVSYHDKNILLTHGHMYNVYFTLDKLYYLAKENNCNLVFYGHTHVQKITTIEDITFVNPGSILDGNYALIDNDKIILK